MHLPNLGTVYLFKRAGISDEYAKKRFFWESVANLLGGAVRDVMLTPTTGEAVRVVLVHPLTEVLPGEISNILDRGGMEDIELDRDLPACAAGREELVLAGGRNEASARAAAELLFRGAAKGVHYFHDAFFSGTLVNREYAPAGERLVVHFPEGVRAGARWLVIWRWTTDAAGVKNRPAYSTGRLRVDAGTPVAFGFPGGERRGTYDFWGTVTDADHIALKMRMDGVDYDIPLKRTQNLSAPWR